jgi:hypothetical protein
MLAAARRNLRAVGFRTRHRGVRASRLGSETQNGDTKRQVEPPHERGLTREHTCQQRAHRSVARKREVRLQLAGSVGPREGSRDPRHVAIHSTGREQARCVLALVRLGLLAALHRAALGREGEAFRGRYRNCHRHCSLPEFATIRTI